MRRALAAAALMLAAAAALAGRGAGGPPAAVGARELAREILDRRPGLVVVDLRAPAAFVDDALPLARNDLPAGPAANGEAVVLYGGDRARIAAAVDALSRRGVRDVRTLAGGVEAWREEVLSPVLPADARTPAQTELADLSAYFGGAPRTDGGASSPPPARRRGC